MKCLLLPNKCDCEFHELHVWWAIKKLEQTLTLVRNWKSHGRTCSTCSTCSTLHLSIIWLFFWLASRLVFVEEAWLEWIICLLALDVLIAWICPISLKSSIPFNPLNPFVNLPQSVTLCKLWSFVIFDWKCLPRLPSSFGCFSSPAPSVWLLPHHLHQSLLRPWGWILKEIPPCFLLPSSMKLLHLAAPVLSLASISMVMSSLSLTTVEVTVLVDVMVMILPSTNKEISWRPSLCGWVVVCQTMESEPSNWC